jgi:hypothetical protein
MERFFRVFLFFLSVLFCLGCESPKNAPPNYPSLEFNVDPTLLEPKTQDMKLRMNFSPPIGWKPVSSTLFVNETHKTYQELEMLISEPKLFFQHKPSNSLCIVSKFLTSPFGTTQDFVSTVTGSLRKQFPEASIQQTTFFKDSLLVNQIRILTSEHVVFKLVLLPSDLDPFEVLYILPKNIYMTQSRPIESSIGSIQVF